MLLFFDYFSFIHFVLFLEFIWIIFILIKWHFLNTFRISTSSKVTWITIIRTHTSYFNVTICFANQPKYLIHMKWNGKKHRLEIKCVLLANSSSFRSGMNSSSTKNISPDFNEVILLTLNINFAVRILGHILLLFFSVLFCWNQCMKNSKASLLMRTIVSNFIRRQYQTLILRLFISSLDYTYCLLAKDVLFVFSETEGCQQSDVKYIKFSKAFLLTHSLLWSYRA